MQSSFIAVDLWRSKNTMWLSGACSVTWVSTRHLCQMNKGIPELSLHTLTITSFNDKANKKLIYLVFRPASRILLRPVHRNNSITMLRNKKSLSSRSFEQTNKIAMVGTDYGFMNYMDVTTECFWSTYA